MNLEQLNSEMEDDLETRFLLFNIDDMVYSISLILALEILQVQHATHIPNVGGAVKGIINLRGKVVPVIDVRLKLGLPEIEYTDKTCIIILEIDNNQIGLVVDSVREVAAITEHDMANPPNGSGFADKFLSSVTDYNGTIILNIDFMRFLQDEMGTLI